MIAFETSRHSSYKLKLEIADFAESWSRSHSRASGRYFSDFLLYTKYGDHIALCGSLSTLMGSLSTRTHLRTPTRQTSSTSVHHHLLTLLHLSIDRRRHLRGTAFQHRSQQNGSDQLFDGRKCSRTEPSERRWFAMEKIRWQLCGWVDPDLSRVHQVRTRQSSSSGCHTGWWTIVLGI